MTNELIFVCGRLCSGKGHYTSRFSDDVAEKIMVSDVVKNIIDKTDRKSLQDTAHLSEQIAQGIIDRLSSTDKWIGVVEGCRQTSIYESILEKMAPLVLNGRVKVVWLDVPDEVRKKRFYDRKDRKDEDYSFEDADRADDKLGLGRFYNYLLDNPSGVTILNYYHRTELN